MATSSWWQSAHKAEILGANEQAHKVSMHSRLIGNLFTASWVRNFRGLGSVQNTSRVSYGDERLSSLNDFPLPDPHYR